MADEPTRDAVKSFGWRVVALIGIVSTIVAMCAKGRSRYRTSAELRIPVAGVEARDLVDSFSDPRDADRFHQAIDILAPPGARVVAATQGRVQRMFSSSRGGLGVYQIDPAKTRCFYYAHLDRYARGLEEGQDLEPGDAIGYVGTTGNAPEGVPHLHFAVLSLTGSMGCADGHPINPIALLR